MTDYEKLKTLLTEFEIEILENTYSHWLIGQVKSLNCRVGKNKIIGEKGFETEFRFKSDDSFIEMEILE